MKALLLATAMIAAPVLAQTQTDTTMAPPATTAPTDSTMPDTTTDTTTDTTAPAQSMPSTDPAMPATTTPAMPAPAGGSGVVFQQPPSVEQAFPAPAPKASYPWCSKTVTDGCKQRRDPK